MERRSAGRTCAFLRTRFRADAQLQLVGEPQGSFGRNVFAGGFLGLDNIGVFDRSAQLPTGGSLEQADGTAWMAFYCQNMLEMALILANTTRMYEEIAFKFVQHFLWIAYAMDRSRRASRRACGTSRTGSSTTCCGCPTAARPGCGCGRWSDCSRSPRSTVDRRLIGQVSEICVDRGPGCSSQTNIPLIQAVLTDPASWPRTEGSAPARAVRRGPAAPHPRLHARRGRVPQPVRDPVAVPLPRRPALLVLPAVDDRSSRSRYTPAESESGMFGGNSNWRGPVWFPVNALVIRALLNLYVGYGDTFTVECTRPDRGGR
jgi:hypothetical protein